MLLGDQGAVESSTWRRLRDGGLVHVISVSGLHVGLLAGTLLAAVRHAGIGERGGLLVAIPSLAGIVLLTGGGPPVLRASLTGALGALGRAVGRRGDEWAVASETASFPNNGLELVKFLRPGEITLLNSKGMTERKAGREENQICAFLWIYTGFPASDYEGINTEAVRERCGRCLAKRDKDIGVDLVAGIPDSGIAHAIGYAMESGKPYRRPLVKYTPGYGRSYTPPSQETRDHIAKMKLVPIKEIIEGNRIVICEDSIVRGTQLKNFTTAKLWEGGAKEIHCRPACPPLMFPCRFNLSTRDINELAARRAIRAIEGRDIEDISEYIDDKSEKYRKMVEWIEKDIEVTTLRYQTVDDMIGAIGLPREKLCLYCWTGDYPKPGE